MCPDRHLLPFAELLIRIMIVPKDRTEIKSRTWLVDLDHSPYDAKHLLIPTSVFLLRALLHRHSLYIIRDLCLQALPEWAARLGHCRWPGFVMVPANQHLLGCHLHRGSRPNDKLSKGTTWG